MIYFVEDDASIRELVTYTLNNTGLPAEGYDRPSAFWTAMGQNKPKLILLDIMLPEEDGMVILRKLRADPATRAIPVMMLTAKGTEYDTVLALDAGADDYVQKPFRMMELLSRIRAKGVGYGEVTLHVGLGTFRPVKADKIEEHHMHSEFYIVEQSEADKINRAHAEGHRVICTGTTSCRTVESAARPDGTMPATSGWTDIFIYPGYQFKCMDALITNFHLPESTLVMLVSAFTKREHVLRAYKVAVREKYRFFSFGDACFFADLKNDTELPAELDPNRNHEFTFLPEDAVAEVEGIPGKSYSWPLAADETPLWKTADDAADAERALDADQLDENAAVESDASSATADDSKENAR